MSRLARRLREAVGAREIIVYGSAARSELTVGSDIDLLVVLPDAGWQIEKQVSALCFDAGLECGRLCSPVCFTEEELVRTPLRASPLMLAARREGIPL